MITLSKYIIMLDLPKNFLSNVSHYGHYFIQQII